MRKLLVGVVCCFAVLAWTHPVEAQTTGLKLGLVWADLDGQTDEPGTTLERRTAWAGGAFVRFGLGPMALQTEVLYVKRGAAVEGAGVTGSPELRTDFVEIPLLLRAGSRGTALYGGAYGAFKVDAKAVSDDAELDLSPEIEDFDYGLVFGLSMGFGEFELDGRYSIGLQNLIRDPTAQELKNRAFMVLGSYTF